MALDRVQNGRPLNYAADRPQKQRQERLQRLGPIKPGSSRASPSRTIPVKSLVQVAELRFLVLCLSAELQQELRNLRGIEAAERKTSGICITTKAVILRTGNNQNVRVIHGEVPGR
jgi:hypothetical protein